uniref:rRNA N-glycosylase n=1 Tax=Oryza meridionalis TaxID=40149 RepID=A0A0E0FA05_9ORYZ
MILQGLHHIDIDVTDPTQGGYTTALNSIRERDQERAGQNTFHGVAITSLNKQWRRINLVHQDRPTVSLLIDESNGYLVGFRRGDGTWMHFNDQELPNVPGTEQRVPGIPIQLSSSYMNLIKDNERPYFSVGRQSLRHSYFVLLNYDAEVDLRTAMMKRQRKALTQLIRPVLEFISEVMSTEDTTPLDMDQELVHPVLRCERDATPLDPNEIKHVSPYGITSREQMLLFNSLMIFERKKCDDNGCDRCGENVVFLMILKLIH